MARCISHALGAPLLIALICSPCIAQAQARSPSVPTAEVGSEAPTGPEVDAPTEARPWYGWQNLAFDVVGGALIAGGLGSLVSNGAGATPAPYIVAFMGIGTYGFGSPFVHFAHGNLWGIGSLATRGAVLGLAFTSASRSCDAGPCPHAIRLGVASIVLGVGIMVVDAVVAREPREAWRVAVAPWADPRARAGGLSVSSTW